VSEPKRIQRKRTKGWRMPEGAVYVGRPTKWGNPFKATDTSAAFAAVATGGRGNVPRDRAHGAVCLYFRYLSGGEIECPITAMMANKEYAERGKPKPPRVTEIQRELRGKDLACFCALDMPCHADVLLEIANRSPAASPKQPGAT
jgi:hypothetical protein